MAGTGSPRRDGKPPSPPSRLVAVVSAAVLVAGVAGFAIVTRWQSATEAHPAAPDRPVIEGVAARHAPVRVDATDLHSVVAEDSIPAVDHPKLAPVSAVTYLKPQEPVIEVTVRGDARAYPLQILMWHEIINDVVGGVPLSVTFCPLCYTALVYERPKIDGRYTTFGTSGKLFNSNLVMYDRVSDSLWPQVTGQAVSGSAAGAVLERHAAQIVSWDEFRTSFPAGKVLTRNTGYNRPYGENPYPGYDDIDSQPFLFTGRVDGRLAAVERVLGVSMDGQSVAFPYLRLQDVARARLATVNTRVAGHPLLVLWRRGATSALDAPTIPRSREVGSAAAFVRRVGDRVLVFESRGRHLVDRQTRSRWDQFGRAVAGSLKGAALRSADFTDSFWFDWAAFHPSTRVWQGKGS